MLSPGFGAILAVEVEEIVVAGNITTTHVPYFSGPMVVVRDVAQEACQCHDAKAGMLCCPTGKKNHNYVQLPKTFIQCKTWDKSS